MGIESTLLTLKQKSTTWTRVSFLVILNLVKRVRFSYIQTVGFRDLRLGF